MKFDLSEFAGKDVVFVGVGQGRSVAGFQTYLEQHADIKSFERVDKEDGAEALAFLRDYDPSQTIFVKNEAIPGPEMPVPYITPLQLFFRLAQDNQLTTVGITGTKGKSTTAALTAHILETAGKSVVLAGNIGVSPLPALSEASPETIFVLELSSYQLSDLKTSPHISACINLYNDHAPWHGSQEAYWEAKHNIMRFAGADDVFIYNPSFPTMQQWATEATCHTVAIDPAEPLGLRDAQLYGDHNRLNALVAREIARQFKVADDVSHSALRSFQPLAHRMQTIVVKDGHTYIDDAIGMTPESTLASLKAVTEHVGPIGCLLLGGQDRDYDFKELLQNVADYKIPALVLFPNTQAKMKAALPAGYEPLILEANSMAEAVAFAHKNAPKNSVVLLSTAAPSYSLWQDFEAKGDDFQAAVKTL